ncbi:hypothetical protein MTO96_024382 [Rhipicephalus appendiculatus]
MTRHAKEYSCAYQTRTAVHAAQATTVLSATRRVRLTNMERTANNGEYASVSRRITAISTQAFVKRITARVAVAGKTHHTAIKAENETWTTRAVSATLKTYATVVKPLRSGTYYDVRVLVIDQDSKYREHGASVTRFRTACGEPHRPPQNVNINNSSPNEIIVRWTNPGKEYWQCWSVNVVLEVNDTPVEFNLTESSTRAINVYKIQTVPYQAVKIRLRLRTPDNKNSSWTKVQRVTSAEDAPGMVPFLSLLQNGSRNATVSWGPPEQENGVIRSYRVVYRPLALRIQPCTALTQLDTTVMVSPTRHSVSLTPLRPYTKYHISVAALTIKYGPEKNATFDTDQAIPEGAPTKLNYTNTSRDTHALTWAEVPCEQRNGPITSYYVEMDSFDPWESELRHDTVSWTSMTYGDLLPYTRYRVKVYAENGGGRSPLFASTNFTTPPAPPHAPGGLEYEQLSQDSILLKWKAPYPPYWCSGTLQAQTLSH